MGRKRAPVRVPFLPNELKLLIVQALAEDRDVESLRMLRGTDSAFASLSRSELYRFVDFRGKSAAALDSFIRDIGPTCGSFVTSISQRPVSNDSEVDFSASVIEVDWGELLFMDLLSSQALSLLPNVVKLDLSVPMCALDPCYVKTKEVLLGWRGMQHVTLRSAFWGRGSFDGDHDAFSPLVVGEALHKYTQLESLRVLGVSSSEMREGEPADLVWQLLKESQLKALHLAGRSIRVFIPHLVRVHPPITHLTLADDDNLPWSDLRLLVVSLSTTLTSLAIRQEGSLEEDLLPSVRSIAPLRSSDVPHLTRLAIALWGELFSPVNKFLAVDSLTSIELGTDDPNFTRLLVDLVAGSRGTTNWPKLKELSYTSPLVTPEDWMALSEVCERRGIDFAPGYDRDGDWPEEFLD